MFSKRISTLFSSAVWFISISLAVSSCFPEPDFADNPEPSLTGFDDLYYKESGPFDSLVIRVNFQDGDGDFGTPEGQEPPLYTPVLNSDGSFQYFDPNDPDQPGFNCRDYDRIPAINPNDSTDKEDTIRAIYNENYYNFAVTLYTKTGNEPNFEEVDFVANCRTRLGGIFFPLKDPEDQQNGKPLEGVLQYGIIGTFDQYRNDSLKIEVQIRDQANHLSNILESEPFTLKEITIGSEE